MGCDPWGHKESDMTEQLTHTHTHTHTVSSHSGGQEPDIDLIDFRG